MALSAVFPMPFDEKYHLGIIQFYAQRFSPFMSAQPMSLDEFGGVWREPSFLYHYVMSWPWRLITWLTDNFYIQVVFMRLFSIMFVVIGLIMFRKLLAKARLSAHQANLIILILALTPSMTLTSAHINYDNLVFLMVVVCLKLAYSASSLLRTKKQLDLRLLGRLIVALLIGSITKYAFLPVACGIVLALGGQIIWALRQQRSTSSMKFKLHWLKVTRRQAYGLAAAIALFGGLFAQRYGVNVVMYGTPTPECNQVLTKERCFAYGPWRRNYVYKEVKPANFKPEPIRYTYIWLRHMCENLTFSLSSINAGYRVGKPLLLMRVLIVGVCIPGVLLSLFYIQRLRKNDLLRLAMVVVAVYTLTLWLQNFIDYVNLGQFVAIQGRYLLPVLPSILLIMTAAYMELFRNLPSLRRALGSFVVLSMLLSGGVLNFVIYSKEDWRWNNSAVQRVNNAAQKIVYPLRKGSPTEKKPISH